MSKGKILVVDDDLDTVNMLRDLLENEGYEVITAYAGRSALEKVKEEKPALVILDIMMPNMDGLTVCQEIKNNPETQNIKVIILTLKDSADTFQEAVEKKSDWFIPKPYGNKYMLSTIAKLLDESKQ